MDVASVIAARTWEQPELFEMRREPMRIARLGAPDADTARETDGRDGSPWFVRLDGRWRFSLAPSVEAVDADFTEPDYDDRDWARVAVPGCWTMQGFDQPIYTNVQMPFRPDAPRVPAENPTGCYRTRFSVPRRWKGRRVVLHVGGAESVLHVWVNGRFAGMAKDSRLASEFDITDLVRAGRNSLACMVVRWSDASYVEDQDQWWHAGIHREVFVYSPGTVRLRNVRVRSAADGSLLAGVEVGFTRRPRPGWKVAAELLDARGRRVVHLGPADVPLLEDPYAFSGHVAWLAATLSRVRPWSAEDPYRYELLVSLLDPEGETREVVREFVGFRDVEVAGNRLLVNGAAVQLYGVNRHDFDPVTGRVVSLESMRRDLVTMKQHGMNALRCAHAPNDPRLLDLCDELGLYVIDEANIEAHATWGSLCNDPRYRSTWVARGSRMVERDENHPSVILWSLGNESGYGANHDALAGWIRRHDPSRPLHYEGAIMLDWAGGTHATDILCPMYAPIDAIRAWAAQPWGPARPLILCEYSHAMGNSNGCLGEYFDAFELAGLQGGFIWEWWDHGLRQRLDDGTVRSAYGGDFGDSPNDGNFCIDGIVWPDGTPKPALEEHRWLTSPLLVEWADRARTQVRVHNRAHFVDSSWLQVRFEVLVDGEVQRRGRFPVPPIGPGESEVVEVPTARPLTRAGQEAHLVLRFVTANELPWAPKGFEVSWRQLEWASARAAPSPPRRRATDALTLGFDVEQATITGLAVGGHELLHEGFGPQLALWRAPTDNDGLKLAPFQELKPLGQWRALGLDALRLIDARIDRGGDRFRRVWAGSDASDPIVHTTTVSFSTGGWQFREEVMIPDRFRDLPRVGVRFALAAGFEQVQWFGKGPHETYPDRARGGLLARHRQSVTDQYVPYVVPQEHGLHCDTRWVELVDAKRRITVRIDAPDPFAFSASHFSAEDLTAATHDVELTPRPETIVHVDHRHRGLGSLSCGPDTLAQYLVGPGTYRWTWSLGVTRRG